MYEAANTSSQTQSQKLNAEIKKTWGKLTDEEIGFQASMPDKFYEAVNSKYSIKRDEAEKTVKKLDSECAAACSTSSGKDSGTASGPTAKAANDSTATVPAAKAANA